ncbi:MAG TPA: 1-phosphofructokinase [Candidatus Enterenecus merdae]|nr:1-phosphofructokinase [Candidatus Enterenecus merdae]
MIYTVTFNPAIDYVVWLDRLEPGTINRVQQELIQFGGKGINVSVVLGRLGVENRALGFLAGFTGQAVERGLAAEGVQTDFIHLPEGVTRINVKVKGREETELNGRGPDIGEAALAELLGKLDELTDADILVLAGSIPASLPGDVYEQILARLEGRNVRVVVDAEGELLCSALAYRPFLIKPNSLELGGIFGKTLHTPEEIRTCAAALQERGARNVLVSMAGDGAILLDEQGGFHQLAAPKGTVRNSVGAGDSMVAGFLAGWLRTGSYAQALRMGTATGSATAFSDGLATRERVEQLLAEL